MQENFQKLVGAWGDDNGYKGESMSAKLEAFNQNKPSDNPYSEAKKQGIDTKGKKPNEVRKLLEERAKRQNEKSISESTAKKDENNGEAAEEKPKKTRVKRTPEERARARLESLIAWNRESKKRDLDFFFGDAKKVHEISNKYSIYDGVIDDDNVVVNVSDGQIKFIKGNPVLVVGSNKAIYLRPWQFRYVEQWSEHGLSSTALVKLNRKYYKTYTFQQPFDDMIFDGKDYDFDDWLQTAKDQSKHVRVRTKGLLR